MNLIKSSIVLPIVIILCSIMWNGCYTQFAASSDESEPTVDPNQSTPPSMIIEPVPFPMEPYYPDPIESHPQSTFPLPPAASMSTVNRTVSTPEPPHRDSGYQRSPSTDQNNSRQTNTTPSRTSWSPAPPPQNPPASSPSNTRTSGSARR